MPPLFTIRSFFFFFSTILASDSESLDIAKPSQSGPITAGPPSSPAPQVIITPQAVKLKLLNCVNASPELSLFPGNILPR